MIRILSFAFQSVSKLFELIRARGYFSRNLRCRKSNPPDISRKSKFFFLKQKQDNCIIRHDFYELYEFDLIRKIREHDV